MSMPTYTAKTWVDYADTPDLSAANVQYMDSGIAAVTAEVIALEASLPTTYQPISAELSALAGLSTAGYAKRLGAGSWGIVTSIPQADVTGLAAALAALQPLDSDLTAIAALVTTAYGRGFLPLADAAAARTYIGAQAAGSYQPLDSDLTAIAALTTQAFGRSILTTADAAAARTLIGAQAAGSYSLTGHIHAIADVTGLQTALDGKQASGSYENSLGLPATNGYLLSSTTTGVRSWVAPYSHPATHPQSVVESASGWITTSLAGKQAAGSYALADHLHAGVYQPVGNYSLVGHGHAISEVTGLQTALDGKQAAGSYQSLDADLTAIAALSTTGFVRRTATNTWSASAMAWADISGVISYGTAAGTVAQGNDSRIVNGQTAYTWGNHASIGYALASALPLKTTVTPVMDGTAAIGSDTGWATGNHVHPTDTTRLAATAQAVDSAKLGGQLPAYYATASSLSSYQTVAGMASYSTKAVADTLYQPLDSDLTAIAALTTTAYGRGFLPLADAAAARTYIGAQAVGSYQPLDADLTAIAALTTTAYGRSVLTVADAAAGRTLLGAQVAGSYALADHLHTGIYQPVGNYSLVGHGHAISEVTGLQTALDSKQVAGSYCTLNTDQTISSVKTFSARVQVFLPTANVAHSVSLSTDTVPAFSIWTNGALAWGSGTSARDTNLYRASASVLKTDDSFVAVWDVTGASFAVPGGTASGFLKANGSIDTTAYQTVAGMSSYLTTASAASTYQPLDTDLTAIAALTTQTFGRSLLTATDAAAGRTLLASLPVANPTFTGVITGPLFIANQVQAGDDAGSGARIALLNGSSTDTGWIMQQGATLDKLQFINRTANVWTERMSLTNAGLLSVDSAKFTTSVKRGSLELWGRDDLVGTRNEHNHAGAYATASCTTAQIPVASASNTFVDSIISQNGTTAVFVKSSGAGMSTVAIASNTDITTYFGMQFTADGSLSIYPTLGGVVQPYCAKFQSNGAFLPNILNINGTLASSNFARYTSSAARTMDISKAVHIWSASQGSNNQTIPNGTYAGQLLMLKNITGAVIYLNGSISSYLVTLATAFAQWIIWNGSNWE